jgi:hypothetical protein
MIMKITILFLLLAISLVGNAQTQKDIISPSVPLVFLGLDYSKIRFTKAAEFINQPQINRFFVDCNNLMEVPPYKNGMAKRLQRSIVKDFSYVTTKNAAVDYHKVFIDDTNYTLSDEDIKNMIADLKIDQQKYKDHIGMLFCEENFSKTEGVGKMSVVFFAVNDLKLLLRKQYTLKPSGFGFMYYWNYINFGAMKKLSGIVKEVKKAQ